MSRLMAFFVMPLLLVALGCNPTNETPEPVESTPRPTGHDKEVTIKAVKYDELTEAIRRHKGKVVVVDFWASWCQPCKKEFPHLMELHRTYESSGLVCVSVSVDFDEDGEKKALAFLKTQGATFPNFRLDEPDEVWQEKLLFKGVPAVFVFDREGKRAGKFTNDDPDNQFDYDTDVVPLVRKLLRAN